MQILFKNPNHRSWLWLLFAGLCLFCSLNLSAQGTYNTYAAPSWQLRGNAVVGDMWLGTRNMRDLHFRTNNIPAAKFDSLGNLYLFQVDGVESADSVLTISNGLVTKIAGTAFVSGSTPRNGLNDTTGFTELGGSLIRNTTIRTEQYGLTILNDKVSLDNFNITSFLQNGQSSVHYNNKFQLNMDRDIPEGASKNYGVSNLYNEISLPRAKWGHQSLVNFHNVVAKGLSYSAGLDTVANITNALIATGYDASGFEPPLITRYVDIWAGYRLPYSNHLPDNAKFLRRVGLLVNGATDNTTIPRYVDILLTADQTLNNADISFLPSGVYGIYQQTAKKNVFKGVTHFDNTSHITLPAGSTAQRPSAPTVADMRYNTTTSAAELFDGSVFKTILSYTQQPAIPNPTGGTVVDVEARAAIASILTTLRNLGLIAP